MLPDFSGDIVIPIKYDRKEKRVDLCCQLLRIHNFADLIIFSHAAHIQDNHTTLFFRLSSFFVLAL